MDFGQFKQKNNLLNRYWVLSRNVGKSGVQGLKKSGSRKMPIRASANSCPSLTLARTVEATAAGHRIPPLVCTWKWMSLHLPCPSASFPASVAWHHYLVMRKSQAGASDWLSLLGFASRNAAKVLSRVFSLSRKRQTLPFPGLLRCRVPCMGEGGKGTGLKRNDMPISAAYIPVSCICSEFTIKILFIAFFKVLQVPR